MQGVDILYDKLIFFIVQDYKKDKMDVNVSIAFYMCYELLFALQDGRDSLGIRHPATQTLFLLRDKK